MITHNATQLQAAHVKTFHVHAARGRQAEYVCAQALKGIPVDKSVVLDSQSQRVFRMRKGILTSSRLINKRLELDKRVRWVPVMVTLTYKASVEWQPDHMSTFVNLVSMWGKRNGYKLPYAWVMELTKSGKPHYHCIVWIPRRLRLPRADSKGWWPHGATNTVRATNPYGYLSKYASKASGQDGHAFPRGARIHGIGGLTTQEAAVVAWWKLPKVLRLGVEGSHKWRRMVGGGWKCIEGDAAGNVYVGEWGLSAIDAVHKRVRLVERPAVMLPRCQDDLIQATKEADYDQSRAESAARLSSLQAYRASWVWCGGARGFEHPDDAPNLELLFPVDQQNLDHYGSLPF